MLVLVLESRRALLRAAVDPVTRVHDVMGSTSHDFPSTSPHVMVSSQESDAHIMMHITLIVHGMVSSNHSYFCSDRRRFMHVPRHVLIVSSLIRFMAAYSLSADGAHELAVKRYRHLSTLTWQEGSRRTRRPC